MGEIIWRYDETSDHQEFPTNLSLSLCEPGIDEFDQLPIGWNRDWLSQTNWDKLPNWFDTEFLNDKLNRGILTKASVQNHFRSEILKELEHQGFTDRFVFHTVYHWRGTISLKPFNGHGGNFYPPVDDEFFIGGFFWYDPDDYYETDCKEELFQQWADYLHGNNILYQILSNQLLTGTKSDWIPIQSLSKLAEKYKNNHNHTIRAAKPRTVWE